MKENMEKSEILKIVIITSIIWMMIIFGLEIFHSTKEVKLFNKGVVMGRDWVEKDIMWASDFTFMNNLTCNSVPCTNRYYCYTINCTEVDKKI